jgi:hypothetical protein
MDELDALAHHLHVDASKYAHLGQNVGPNTYERWEDGVRVSSLIVEGDCGDVVYEVVGVDFRYLA